MTNQATAPSETAVDGNERERLDLLHHYSFRTAMTRPKLERPKLPTKAQYEAWTSSEKDEFNAARYRWHANPPKFSTRQVEKILGRFDQQMLQGSLQEIGIRPGLVISGEANIGKTELGLTMAKRHIMKVAAIHDLDTPFLNSINGMPYQGTRIPVLYVSVQGQATPAALLQDMCAFLGRPQSSRARAHDLKFAVIQTLKRSMTDLVIFDDLQYFGRVDAKSRSAAVSFFKSLVSAVPANFVFIGVDLENTSILTEGMFTDNALSVAQFASRNVLHKMKKNELGDDEEKSEWKRIITGFEDHFVLLQHQKRSLTNGSWKYLHARTNGKIGALRQLMTSAVFDAVTLGTEAVTVELLETVPGDYTSETLYPSQTTKRTQQPR